MGEICGDNRFLIIERAKKHLLETTNIETSEGEMKVLDSFLFRCWQCDWLEKFNNEFHKGITIAKKLMDAIIYDSDFVNRWNPFNEENHYGFWLNEIARALIRPIMTLGEGFFTDDRIDDFAIGNSEDREELIKSHPELKYLDDLLEKYYNYLSTLEWQVPNRVESQQLTLREMLDITPHYIEHDGVTGIFRLKSSLSGKWHCEYMGIIGFHACDTPEEAVQKVLNWVNDGMDVERYISQCSE